MTKYLFYLSIVLVLAMPFHALSGQKKSAERLLSDSLTKIANSIAPAIGKVSVNVITTKQKNYVVTVSDKFSYLPFRPDNVARIYSAINSVLLPKEATVVCQVNNKAIEEYIPNIFRLENVDETKRFKLTPYTAPLVSNLSRPFTVLEGLQNRHIALWQSHGLFFDQKTMRWKWQRARINQTVEDLYTQSYVLPYLLPMLENAGANVLIPRERDTQLNEVIVDNDAKDKDLKCREHSELKRWKTGDSTGFAHPKLFYLQGANPFRMGTFRTVQSVAQPTELSNTEWIPLIPKEGTYAVYVSYKSLENSVDDAHYTVYHKGGKTDFVVNQTIGGGTWIYLGTFDFEQGRGASGKVLLTNYSKHDGKIITADAVKFGGGMGNIARTTYQSEVAPMNFDSITPVVIDTFIKPLPVYDPEVSNYPRFAEGARYWLQWAGIPDTIYLKNNSKSDYIDDIQSRGCWVNYLNNGSINSPLNKGLGIPLDLAFAFHTDAGTTNNDSIVGTLGIYTLLNSFGESVFRNGVSRWASRDLTDIVQSQLVSDIRRKFAPEWQTRGMWNKSYSESRVPQVPTMLLELLSHQNFADMRYGHDPRFKFEVSRSIYKGMLKYLAHTNGFQYTVQPLPVKNFSSRLMEKNTVKLQWNAVIDEAETTAVSTQYVLYTRIDNGGFDNGVIVNADSVVLPIVPGKVYSYKVAAANRGGESFPSEVLSVYRAPNERGEVLIVNGFNRLSAPQNFTVDSTFAGFLNDRDAGVPYISEIAYVGKQYEFTRSKQWVDDDAPGFGASNANYEAKVIAGNSFDYPFLHGKAIKMAHFSYSSCSVDAVNAGIVPLNQYKLVDLILGKQKQTFIGNSKKSVEFKTFPLVLQQLLINYCFGGGKLMVSGAHIGSDLYVGKNVLREDKQFMELILKCKFKTENASVAGGVRVVNTPSKLLQKHNFSFYTQPNDKSYYVESPNAIDPVGDGAFTFCRYTENSLSAAVAFSGAYKVCALGFPFEIIENEKDRNKLMGSILDFFLSNEVLNTRTSIQTR